ncbi:hypothetical protein BOTBODRAFT_171279 [Botryobasidium botryosum FD-172 SS1]|uniref:CxC2-like cysteine cluster KDZ transposase-associated domain-containing protein n=1 Tax=Botryobasidium botryosum (strain FD-172 SS1) TaxID=930990 RepID=A0A067N2T1_BOTB1|nr:hypothetical protein BOTBODRAFT_171279 [Botryobasidium botryosum FD-172 SS1]
MLPRRKPVIRSYPNPYQRAHTSTILMSHGGRLPVPMETHHYLQCEPPKKRPAEPSSNVPPPPQKRPKIFQGASVIMSDLKPHFNEILTAMLTHECLPTPTSPCRCGATANTWCAECWESPFYCASCIVEQHRNLPFHRVEQWNGRFFERKELVTLGLVIGLRHHGHLCTQAPSNCATTKLTIVHTNGVHNVIVAYCHCAPRVQDTDQLLLAGLFPGTFKKPGSAFTFAVLKEHHIHSLQSKKAAYDYFEALRRLTDNVLPNSVKDQYREFLRIAHVWAYLKAFKCSGQYYNIDKLLPSTRLPGSLAVHCPGCPKDGFNMAPNWRNTPPNKRHIHTTWNNGDGNHGLQRKGGKVDDPDNVELWDGNGYFVNTPKYEAFLKTVPDSEEKSTVAAVICGRHAMFRPGGMVDMQKGEKYAHMDYVLASVLRQQAPLLWIMFLYDIACQYWINLLKQFKASFPGQVSTAVTLRYGVGKLHIQGHTDDCMYRHSLNYMECCGRTHGEVVETCWAEGNQAGVSTREMNAGHRHNALDDFHGDWNWRKVQKMSASIYKKFVAVQEDFKKKDDYFAALSESMPPNSVETWKSLSTEPKWDGEQWASVYRMKKLKGPSQGDTYKSLCEREQELKKQSSFQSLHANFLDSGLRIQAMQRRLKRKIADAGASPPPRTLEDIERCREQLFNEVSQLRKYQDRELPQLRDHLTPVSPEDVENIILQLPSDFGATDRTQLGLDALGKCEYDLREGEAYDAIRHLREALKENFISVQFKKKNIHGQKDSTRSHTVLKKMKEDVHQCAQKYRQARAALVSLGLNTASTKLQPLHNRDCYLRNVTQKRRLSAEEVAEPWFWTLEDITKDGEPLSEWSLNVDSVRWFRARADRDRYQEELEILPEELNRINRHHSHMCSIWAQLARKSTHTGTAAYAFKKAAMYERLAVEAQNYIEKIEAAK